MFLVLGARMLYTSLDSYGLVGSLTEQRKTTSDDVITGLDIFVAFVFVPQGASFYFIEVGLEHLSPVWLVSLRLISGAICLCAWLTITSVFFALSAGVLARLSCHGCAE